MQLITVHLPIAYLEGIDTLITDGSYPNRSEAIRVAIRDLLKNELGGLRPRTEVVNSGMRIEI